MSMKWFLGTIFTFFIVVLVAVAVIAKRAHPILLDEHGRPLEADTADTGAR